MVVCSIPLLTVSLFTTSRGEIDGHFYERCPEGHGVLKGPTGIVKLERSGDWITSSTARNDLFFPALLTSSSVGGTTLTSNTRAEDIWYLIWDTIHKYDEQ